MCLLREVVYQNILSLLKNNMQFTPGAVNVIAAHFTAKICHSSGQGVPMSDQINVSNLTVNYVDIFTGLL